MSGRIEDAEIWMIRSADHYLITTHKDRRGAVRYIRADLVGADAQHLAAIARDFLNALRSNDGVTVGDEDRLSAAIAKATT